MIYFKIEFYDNRELYFKSNKTLTKQRKKADATIVFQLGIPKQSEFLHPSCITTKDFMPRRAQCHLQSKTLPQYAISIY